MGVQQDSDSRRICPDVPDHRDTRGRGFAAQVAMAICLALIGWCVPAASWGFAPSGFTLLMWAAFPLVFPVGFLCLVLYGQWLDSASEEATGIRPRRFQLNIKHLLWLVLASAILCSLVVFAWRLLLSMD